MSIELNRAFVKEPLESKKKMTSDFIKFIYGFEPRVKAITLHDFDFTEYILILFIITYILVKRFLQINPLIWKSKPLNYFKINCIEILQSLMELNLLKPSEK